MTIKLKTYIPLTLGSMNSSTIIVNSNLPKIQHKKKFVHIKSKSCDVRREMMKLLQSYIHPPLALHIISHTPTYKILLQNVEVKQERE